MEYLRIFKTLQDFKVRYLLCGGLAVNLYGIPRMTADIDLLLDFEEKNLEIFENAIRKLNYEKRLPVPIKNFLNMDDRKKAIQEKNLVAYSYYSQVTGFMDLDVLLDVPMAFEQLWEKKEVRVADNTEIFMVSVKHLIELKEYANRIQDQNDVFLLSKLLK
jgi:hypothetical protein